MEQKKKNIKIQKQEEKLHETSSGLLLTRSTFFSLMFFYIGDLPNRFSLIHNADENSSTSSVLYTRSSIFS
jgi:hypothetical protein